LLAIAKRSVEEDDSVIFHTFDFVLAAEQLSQNKNPTAGLAVGLEDGSITSTPDRRPAQQQSGIKQSNVQISNHGGKLA
jgi:hypothetical protein